MSFLAGMQIPVMVSLICDLAGGKRGANKGPL